MNLLSEAAEEKKHNVCQNVSFIISVFPHLRFVLVAVCSWTSSAELLQQVHGKYPKVTQMWKHSGHWIMAFSFVSSRRSFQICCQKWHLLCVFIAMHTILYLPLDEVYFSTNRQAWVCVLMSKNALLKVFPFLSPFTFWIDSAFFFIFCHWISVHHIYFIRPTKTFQNLPWS